GDGSVTISDVTAIQRYLAEMQSFYEEERMVADTNADGVIDISDATYLQMYLAGYDVVLA
ncbi:MAG: dockerin type I repeat-containing protein, partial [Ruminococcus sp.]|nr:dockerin type I repeat-containing protein [Ruminococcus sp.]MBQ1944618.1 dockerin type I repeat-containing protein [Ruminococcus sp.]